MAFESIDRGPQKEGQIIEGQGSFATARAGTRHLELSAEVWEYIEEQNNKSGKSEKYRTAEFAARDSNAADRSRAFLNTLG